MLKRIQGKVHGQLDRAERQAMNEKTLAAENMGSGAGSYSPTNSRMKHKLLQAKLKHSPD